MTDLRARDLCTTILAVSVATLLGGGAARAEPSTSRGQISVAQVTSMLDQAATNPTARQALTAYLAGVGETTGWLVDAVERKPPSRPCQRHLGLDSASVRQALDSARVAGNPAETPATPLIVRDMMKRAGCSVDNR